MLMPPCKGKPQHVSTRDSLLFELLQRKWAYLLLLFYSFGTFRTRSEIMPLRLIRCYECNECNVCDVIMCMYMSNRGFRNYQTEATRHRYLIPRPEAVSRPVPYPLTGCEKAMACGHPFEVARDHYNGIHATLNE